MKKAGNRIFFTSCCLLLIGLFSFGDLFAQRNELGFGLGGATYTGDIIRKVDPSQLGIQGTLFGRRNFDNVWSLRAGVSFARLNAADSINPIDAAAVYRNAGFKGSVFEATAIMEYHFLDFTHPQSQYRYSPYGFFGLGYSFFSGEGQTYQGDPTSGDYSLGTPIIPFGLGIKYKLSERWTLGLELGFRATFSDLFDKIDSKTASIPRFPDSSNPNVPFGINYGSYGDKDWYYFLGLTLSYSFNSVQCYAY